MMVPWGTAGRAGTLTRRAGEQPPTSLDLAARSAPAHLQKLSSKQLAHTAGGSRHKDSGPRLLQDDRPTGEETWLARYQEGRQLLWPAAAAAAVAP